MPNGRFPEPENTEAHPNEKGATDRKREISREDEIRPPPSRVNQLLSIASSICTQTASAM
ncbi:hypothetical protein AA0488_1404 [Kozakia baliensis NRIC 0488]|nr:hypothetical protein AA0488_1404 [Kozakia baliensis NRIC 0488]GEL63695.1 hypothetical protein KBA01_09810 [Kozakia baliensis]